MSKNEKFNNQDVLEQLISGKDSTEKIKIEGKEIFIRPLTDGELSQLKALEKEPVNVDITFKPGEQKRKGFRDKVKKELEEADEQEGKARLNSGTMSESQDETKYLAIAMSLSIGDNEISSDFVKNLAAGVPDKIFKEVIKLSNLEEASLDTVKNFLKNR